MINRLYENRIIISMEIYSEYKMNEYGQFVDIESLMPFPQQPPKFENPNIKTN